VLRLLFGAVISFVITQSEAGFRQPSFRHHRALSGFAGTAELSAQSYFIHN